MMWTFRALIFKVKKNNYQCQDFSSGSSGLGYVQRMIHS